MAAPATIELQTSRNESQSVQSADPNYIASTRDDSLQAESVQTETLRDISPSRSRLADSTAPDGGSGWIVVAACALVTAGFNGSSGSWGVMQAALTKRKTASSSKLSFVGSTSITCCVLFGLVGARLLRLLGSRDTALLGVTLLAGGEVLSGFTVDNIGGLFVTAGVITGLGNCLCFMVCSIVPSQYFSSKLGLANGLVKAGGGLGGAVCSLALNSLIENFGGPAWAFRVLGFVTLGLCLPAAWFIKDRYPVRSATFIEWRLFLDFSFLMVFLAGAIAVFALFVPAFFLPLYAQSLGLPTSTGAALLAGFNFSTAIGRLASGPMCDWIGPLNTFFIAMLINSLTMLAIWLVSDTLGPLVTFAIINGVANGSFFTSLPTAVGKLFGSARVAVAMGMVVTGWSAGYFAGAPIAGYLLQAYGGDDPNLWAYRPAIFYAGSTTLAAAGVVLMLRLRLSLSLFKKF